MKNKLPLIESIKLRFTDPVKYDEYKYLQRLKNLPEVNFTSDPSKIVASFKHSGNASDVIYALPALFALAKRKPIHLFLVEDKPVIAENKKLPLANVKLSRRIINMLQPLMWHQPGITSCDPYGEQTVDFDLDLVQSFPIDQSRGNIAHWYFQLFGVAVDLSLPWLRSPIDEKYKDAIVIARSLRKNCPGINYAFLKDHGRCVFVGIEEEYMEMKKVIPQLEHKVVYDFLEMAAVINGSKLFIGNQSLPYAIAEGLKAMRVLEVYPLAPNVVPAGAEAYVFSFQVQFEKIIGGLV